MRSKREKLFFQLLFIFFICLFFNSTYAIIWHNGAGSGYGGDDGDSTGKNITIETYIVEGGGYFLSANSSTQKLLELVELKDLKGVDSLELQDVLNIALVNIQKALETFDKLIETAEAAPYNEIVINKLLSFDYEKFRIKNGLNSVVFAQVEDYLKKGDITGVFKKVHSDLKDINAMLDAMNEAISQNKMPHISEFWKLNEKFAEVSLFGSYAAQVFNEIKKHK